MNIVRSYIATVLLVLGRFKVGKKLATNEKVRNWTAGAAAGTGIVGLGAAQLLSLLGFTAVAHSSGAIILTGAGGYIAGTYGIAVLVLILTAPITIFALILCVFAGAYVLWKKRSGKQK